MSELAVAVSVSSIELGELLSRLVRAEEALEDGDPDLAYAVIVNLEADVASTLATQELRCAA